MREWRLSRFLEFGPDALRWENIGTKLGANSVAKLEGIAPPLWRISFNALNNIMTRGRYDESKMWDAGDNEMANYLEEFEQTLLKTYGKTLKSTIERDGGQWYEAVSDMFWYHVAMAGEFLNGVSDQRLKDYKAGRVILEGANAEAPNVEVPSINIDSLKDGFSTKYEELKSAIDSGKSAIMDSIVGKEGEGSAPGEFNPRGAYPVYFAKTKGAETINEASKQLVEFYDQYSEFKKNGTNPEAVAAYEKIYTDAMRDPYTLSQYFRLRQAENKGPSLELLEHLYASADKRISAIANMYANISWHYPQFAQMTDEELMAKVDELKGLPEEQYRKWVEEMAGKMVSIDKPEYANAVRQRYISLGLGE